MSSFLNGIARDALGSAGSIRGPLRQKSESTYAGLRGSDTVHPAESARIGHPQSSASKRLSHGPIVAAAEEAKQVISNQACQGKLTTADVERESPRTTKQSRSTSPLMEYDESASTAPSEPENVEEEAQLSGSSSSTLQDDIRLDSNSVLSPSLQKRVQSSVRNSHPEIPPIQPVVSSESGKSDLSFQSGKNDSTDKVHLLPDTGRRVDNERRSMPEVGNDTRIGTKSPKDKTLKSKAHSQATQVLEPSPLNTNTDNVAKQMPCLEGSATPEAAEKTSFPNTANIEKGVDVGNKKSPEKRILHPKANFGRIPSLEAASQTAINSRVTKKTEVRDFPKARGHRDRRVHPFSDDRFHNDPESKIESHEPLVHIGQIDIIIEAPPQPSSNKVFRSVESAQPMNASTTFMRRL